MAIAVTGAGGLLGRTIVDRLRQAGFPVLALSGSLASSADYEVRRWRDGIIDDVAYAVDSPVMIGTDAEHTQRLLDQVPAFPTATWGLDELGTGEMWNSNSLISWLLASSGHDIDGIVPPHDGRAPGWHAGMVRSDMQMSATYAQPTCGTEQ